MFTILHGDNTLKSRQALLAIKEKYRRSEIIELPPRVDLTTVKQSLESASLFAKEKLVIVENLLSGKGKRVTDEVVSYLRSGNFDTNIVLWEGKKIAPSVLSSFKHAQPRLFRFEPILFRFLDSIKPRNQKKMLYLFHQVLKREATELVFFMIARQIRLLLALKTKSQIPEVTRLARWQRNKLTKQSGCFSQGELIKVLRRLYQIEYQQKNALSCLSLVAELDILLTTL